MGTTLGVIRDNITMQKEKDFGLLPSGVRVWHGSLPWNTGDVFPDKDIIKRADISYTNRMIYNNELEDIFQYILAVTPEIDPTTGFQVREIITNLPLLPNIANNWVSLMASAEPIIDCKKNEVEAMIKNSNFISMLQGEIRSRFIDNISAIRVDTDMNNSNPVYVPIASKNISVFVNESKYTCVDTVVIHNTYNKDGKSYVEFTENHYDGIIKRTVFEYNNGIIGDKVEDLCYESTAFGGKYKESPIVLFKHNVINDLDIYGTAAFEPLVASASAVMRSMQNLLRLGERTREMTRVVPESALTKSINGSNIFFNRGTVSYSGSPDNKPGVEYIVPDIKIAEAVEVLNKAIKQFMLDSKLSPVFFDTEKLGSSVSGQSIKMAMYATILEAARISTELKPSLTELIRKTALLADIEIKNNDISIQLSDSMYTDSNEESKLYNEAYKDGTMDLETVIKKREKVSASKALELANKVRAEKGLSVTVDNIEYSEIDNLNEHGVENLASESTEDAGTVGNGLSNNNVKTSQELGIIPRDIRC